MVPGLIGLDQRREDIQFTSSLGTRLGIHQLFDAEPIKIFFNMAVGRQNARKETASPVARPRDGASPVDE